MTVHLLNGILLSAPLDGIPLVSYTAEGERDKPGATYRSAVEFLEMIWRIIIAADDILDFFSCPSNAVEAQISGN